MGLARKVTDNALSRRLARATASWLTIVKPSDETTNTDTTLSNDSKLQFGVAASTKYRFRFVIFYDTPTAADFKYDVNGPGSPTLVLIDTFSLAPGATAWVITRNSSFAFGPNSIVETSGTIGRIEISGILHNGTTAGTVAFRWAQNSSNGSNTTVRAGSYVEYSATSS